MSASAYQNVDAGARAAVMSASAYQNVDAAGQVDDAARWPKLLADGAAGLLGLCFLISPARADPFIVAPLVAMYALREDDRRALFLYLVMSVAAVPLDLVYISSGAGGWLAKLVALGALALKGVLLVPALKVHDAMPDARAASSSRGSDPAKLQAKVQETVEAVLREVLVVETTEARSNPLPPKAAATTARPPSTLPPPPVPLPRPPARGVEDDVQAPPPPATPSGASTESSWEQV